MLFYLLSTSLDAGRLSKQASGIFLPDEKSLGRVSFSAFDALLSNLKNGLLQAQLLRSSPNEEERTNYWNK